MRHREGRRQGPSGFGVLVADPDVHRDCGASRSTLLTAVSAERGGDGDGLRGWAMNASTQSALGGMMGRERPAPPAAEHKKYLLISRSAIELSERSRPVVGRRPSGKSRVKGSCFDEIHNITGSDSRRISLRR